MSKFRGFFVIGVLALLVGCNQSSNRNTNVMDSSQTLVDLSKNIVESGSNHYVFQNQNDTIKLDLHIEGTHAKGTLTYSLREKDRNHGSIEGTIVDGLLIADYTFASEGMMSVRQVAFKFVDTDLVEGYGDMVEQDNKLVFKNPKSLSYNESPRLKKQ